MMKKIYTALSLMLVISLSVKATDYIVSGAGTSADNGTYVETGTKNGKALYLNGGKGIYWDGLKWCIGAYPAGMGTDYYNSSSASIPPATGWTSFFGSPPIPTVAIQKRSISYSTGILTESVANDGSLVGKVAISYNKFNGDIFTGTYGENYVTSGKVILTNVPAGLTPVMIRNNDSTLTLSFTGNASSHTNLNDTYAHIFLKNTSVSGNDTSVVLGHADSLQINFRQEYTVATSGADFTVIANAIAASSADDIIKISGETFTESNLNVSHPLIFIGQGANKTIIQAAATPFTASGEVPIFKINHSETDTTEFSGLTIQNGNNYKTSGNGYGGGVFSWAGSLSFSDCRIVNNQTHSPGSGDTHGGGVFASNLQMFNCEVSGNKVLNDNMNGNVYGGGLSVMGNVLIVNCTFSGNSSAVNAGGVLANGRTTIINSTITANTAGAASGLYTSAQGSATNCIIYGNIGSQDLHVTSAITATNCIIGSNDGAGTITSVNVSTADPKLSALANNGGTTQTHALQAASPAIDAGATGSDIPTKDPRGYCVNGIRDIGAFEFNGFAVCQITVNNPQKICQNGSYSINNHTYTTVGNHNDTLRASSGIDSIIVTILTVNLNDTTKINAAVCKGTSHPFYGSNLITTGKYYHTLTSSVKGCDSIIALNLRVNPVDTTNISTAICEGTSHNFYGAGLTAKGKYYHSLTSSVTGCDSVIALNLSVNLIDTTSFSVGLCHGDSTTFYAVSLTTAGKYYHTLTSSVTGCDSVIALKLTFNSIDTTTTSVALTNGGSYTFFGTTLTSSGVYYHTLSTVVGCDSVIAVKLDVLTVFNTVTPNGDGFNDTWEISNAVALKDHEIIVFNIFGHEVFHQTGYDTPWDGKKDGETLPNGEYYYLIKGDKYNLKGALILMSK